MENNLMVKIKDFKDAKKGDLLAFDGKKWTASSVETVLSVLLKRMNDLEDKFVSLEAKTNSSLLEIRTEIAEEKKLIATVLKGLV